MNGLLKVMLILAAFFASTFIIARLAGFLSLDDITSWFESLQDVDPLVLFVLVVALLFSDLFIAIPTLTITILSGYFLGFAVGSSAAITGMMLAGTAGYGLSRRFGERVLRRILSSDEKRNEAIASFQTHGLAMILLSRVSPILPEVSACMAGMTGMRFSTFILVWSANTIPYATIAAYSGSISSLGNPQPAIYTAIALNAVLWLGWVVMRKRARVLASD